MWKTLMAVGGLMVTVLAMVVISGMFFSLGLWIGLQLLGG